MSRKPKEEKSLYQTMLEAPLQDSHEELMLLGAEEVYIQLALRKTQTTPHYKRN